MSNNKDKLQVLIITVDEYYYIPKFLQKVVSEESIEIIGITGVPPSLGTQSTPRFMLDLLRRFGPLIFTKQLAFYGTYFLLDIVNRLRNSGEPYSPKTLSERHGIEYEHTKNVNSTSYVEYVESKSPDVIASVATPQKFDPGLYELANGCSINIHSSLLPEYRGLSPSFWTLYHGEDQTGITVHYIDEDLDTGDIILQETLPIQPDDTLHSLNTRVAQKGSSILVESLEQIRTDSVDSTSIDPDEGSYYSMPSREQVKDFIRRGNKFY